MRSFKNEKFALAEAATLEYEDHNKPLILSSDAFETHVVAVLEQKKEDGKMVPLEFFFEKPTKVN